MNRVTICGGGNAAHVLIPLANKAGYEVDVFAPFDNEARQLHEGMNAGGGLTASFGAGTPRSIRGRARRVSAIPAEVIPEAQLILLAVPAFAHAVTLQTIAPYLRPGVTIVALPARSGFDMQACALLDVAGLSATIAGLQTLPWACRITDYGQEVTVLGVKARVDMAVLPATRTAETVALLGRLLHIDLCAIDSFLALTLANTGQLIHPGIMYGRCHGREETTYAADEIPLFYQGVDAATVDILQALSDEVQLVARAVARLAPEFTPQQVTPLYQWLLKSYPDDITDTGSLGRALVSNRAYRGLRLPVRPAADGRYAIDFKARYLSEDVPCGLVVVRGIAELAGIATPCIDTVITWAQDRLRKCYLENGTLSGADLPATRAPQAYGITTLLQM